VNDYQIFCDGGVILKNPSPHGGTWAWVFVRDGAAFLAGSGTVTPESVGLPLVENNVTELVAAVEALEAAPNDWCGVLYTDSLNTLRRLTQEGAKMNGVTAELARRCGLQRIRHRLHQREGAVKLLDGHPTKKHLRLGVGKRGNPVSVWNVRCDETCQELARLFALENKL
jgi:ribonuclease HI